MAKKRRLSISLDDDTYNRLHSIRRQYGFKSIPEMIVAFAHVFLRCVNDADDRRHDMDANDRAYIEGMFSCFAESITQPDGSVPKKGFEVHIDSESWQKTKTTSE